MVHFVPELPAFKIILLLQTITKACDTAKVTQEKAYIMKYKLIKNCIESKEPFKFIPTAMCKILPEISANCQKD